MRALALIGLLAGCTIEQTIVQPPKPVPAAKGPAVVVTLDRAGKPAHDLVEAVAVRCWLDGVLGGAAMVVDKQTGRVIIDGETETLLAADFLPGEGVARVRLSGPSIGDAALQDRLIGTLEAAAATGETACPPLVG